MSSNSSSVVKAVIKRTIGIIFWLLVWEIVALIVNVRFLFPTVGEVVIALIENAFLGSGAGIFWSSVGLSLLRVVIGLLIGVLLGMSLAVLINFAPILYDFISPLITVLRSTPVASFIMILWLLISDIFVPTLIASIIVLPIVWESAYSALSNPDRELSEIADIYAFSKRKRFFLLTMPSMIKSVIPSIISAAGLAWKSGIAAEIITYTKGSIGRLIANSKNDLDGANLFAWTLVVVILSVLVEKLIKNLVGRAKSVWE